MKKLVIFIFFFQFLILLSDFARASNDIHKEDPSLINIVYDVKSDYKAFYSNDNLIHMGIAYVVGGVMANTNIDESIRDGYQSNLRSSHSDDAARIAKMFGEGAYMIPLSLLAVVSGGIIPQQNRLSYIATWGRRSARAYFVGGPPTLLMQRFTGASRPGETSSGSHWKPFSDSNGLSGHAFIGAVPFLTIAHMSNKPFIRYFSYMASTLASLSRINDDDHYASQAFLGWCMALAATNAVVKTDLDKKSFTVMPRYVAHGFGIRVSWNW
jgi:PAP2 superfamily